MPSWHSTTLVWTAWVGHQDPVSLRGHIALGGTKQSLPGLTDSSCCHLGGMFSKAPLIQKTTWIVRWAAAKQGEMSHAVIQTCVALEGYCIFPERRSMWERDAGVTGGPHHFPRHTWSSGRDTTGFCSALSKEKKKKKAKHINKLQAQYKTPKPIILSLREMKREVSPQGMTTEAETHSLPPVLLSCSPSLQSALLQRFKLHSIITPEPFVKPQF